MPQEKWFIETKRADFNAIGEKFGISPVLARIIRNRDMISEQEVDYYLNGTLDKLHDPHQMRDMDKGANLLLEKVQSGSRIRIIGDYDVDGVCATYVLKKALSVLGGEISAVIPHRVRDGYGLNEQLIRTAAEDGIDTIVTCDNGIAAAKEISLAKELGMTVIVTDHHEVPYEETEDCSQVGKTGESEAAPGREAGESEAAPEREAGESETGTGPQAGKPRREILPPADAVIDPKQEACMYPYDGICGAFVAFKLVQVLSEQAAREGLLAEADRHILLHELLEFATIATICDVMLLLDENRILVKYGLQYLPHSSNLGLRTLIEVCGVSGAALSNYHVGFVIGPCLNATGRLDSALRALELFETQKEREAVVLATDLKEMNESRKNMTEKACEKAVCQIEHGTLGNDRVLVVYLPSCHESIAGIVAGRIRERYNRPVFVVTDSQEGLKGSGRSVEAYHMYEGLHGVAHLLTKYGGHRLAAGFSLPKENLDAFRLQLNAQCRLTEEDFIKKVMIDVPMPIRYATLAFVQELSRLEPFGNGNPKPVFADKALKVSNLRIRGKNGNVASFLLTDEGGYTANGIYFGEAQAFADCVHRGGNVIKILYYPEQNEFRGKVTLQIVVTSYQIAGE